MNQHKQIVSWHFTKTEQFDYVEDLLARLKSRSNKAIEMFIIDNCCKWKKKIRETLGPEVMVKLDPFHAIQRITSTIRKTHPFHRQMCEDLHHLFRQVGDSGKIRTQPTVSSNVILKRLDAIIRKWEGAEHLIPGQSLISLETREAVIHLKRHIANGCCSGIPEGCATSSNENLHR